MGLFVAEYAIATSLCGARGPSGRSKLPGGDAAPGVSWVRWKVLLGPLPPWCYCFETGKLLLAVPVLRVGSRGGDGKGHPRASAPARDRRRDHLYEQPSGHRGCEDVFNPVETIMLALGLIALSSLLIRLRRSRG